MKNTRTHYFIIGSFVTLYLLVSVISTIHVISFFSLSNPTWLAVSLAIGFEVGAAASLASLMVLEKMNRVIVWMLFIILTLMQAMGNTYYAYTHLHDFTGWVELFGLQEEDLIYQKRMLAIISGAILPIVALGFIKSLVDYIKPQPASEEQAPAKIAESTVAELPIPEKSEEPTPEPELVKEFSISIDESPEPKKVQEVLPKSTATSRIISPDDRLSRGMS